MSTAVATSRRGAETARLRSQADRLRRELDQGVWNTRGEIDDYLVQRAVFLREELARAEDLIAELDALTDDELSERYDPPPVELPDGFYVPEFVDTLARGQRAPAGRVVTDSRGFG